MWKKIAVVVVILGIIIPRFMNWYYSITIDRPQGDYDFIIVGGGTTGSVVASRLSENPNWRILLLEAGENDLPNPLISIPLIAPLNARTKQDWEYFTTPQNLSAQQLTDKKSYWPRGKVLGGSSSINCMNFVRGAKEDYDKWETLGAKGWDFENVIKYFQNLEDASSVNNKSKERGQEGPLKISYGFRTPLSYSFIESGKELSYESGDYNAGKLEGFHFVQTTMHNGARHNAASAYLRPIANERKNRLHIIGGAHVRKIIFKKDKEGIHHASGVVYMKDDEEVTVNATKEVILSAGSIATPQILMLSGVGPSKHLEDVGVEIVEDLPGVGGNLKDHPSISVCFVGEDLKEDDVLREKYPLIPLLTYMRDGSGHLQSGCGVDAHAFIRTKHAQDASPDLQLLCSSIEISTSRNGQFVDSKFFNLNQEYIERKKAYAQRHNKRGGCDFNVLATGLHPRSVGDLKLASNDYKDHPQINPRYLEEYEDVQVFLEAFNLLEKLESTEALKKLGIRMNLLFDECEGQEFPKRTKSCYEAVIRRLTTTLYHPVGTAKMGSPDDVMSVVDPRLRVYRVKKLRIADASIMPDLPSGNTVAACYMVGEKAADLIKEDWIK